MNNKQVKLIRSATGEVLSGEFGGAIENGGPFSRTLYSSEIESINTLESEIFKTIENEGRVLMGLPPCE